MSVFRPDLTALPPEQRVLWARLPELPNGFVLYGGTALALRLGHRVSVDFDLFTSLPVDPGGLARSVPFLSGATLLDRQVDTLTMDVVLGARSRPVKVSFFGGLGLPVLDAPDLAEGAGIPVASLRDLAGTKAKALQDRIELKDYRDIAALLDSGMTLSEIAAAAVAIFPGQVDHNLTISAITWFDGPEMRDVPQALKRRLRSAAIGGVSMAPPKPRFASIADAARAVGR